jgi:glycine C-acetyltransferase
MLDERARAELAGKLAEIRDAGTWKEERVLLTAQGVSLEVHAGAAGAGAGRAAGSGAAVLNFCANNYLGLAAHPRVVAAAHAALDRWGYGMASVRFICGTQEVHRELEKRMAGFLGTEDALLYSSCFDANGGLFEPLLDGECALVSDQLNHASLIDGARLCKARRLLYAHGDMGELAARLREASGARLKMIVTDGVFSMDGDFARLPEICALAEEHGALLAVDDSHATGFIGAGGRGTAEHFGVGGRVDVITTTFGKALGGATGGCVAGRKEIVALLRQRSRPYLFSNSLPPVVAAASIAVIDLLTESTALRDRLDENTRFFRAAITAAGFAVKPGTHPIVPIMLFEEKLAMEMARRLLAEGIYVIGFSHPVVPKGQARIRVQVSAAHTREELERACGAFARVGRALGVPGPGGGRAG